MKIIGNKSISSAIKVFLIVLFIICITVMLSLPIFLRNLYSEIDIIEMKDVILEMIFMYIAAIPALLMIIEFERIFNDFSKEDVFSRKIENRLKRSSLYSLAIGIVFILNCIIYNCFYGGKIFDEPFRIMYEIVIILIALIFLILSVGLMILKNVYRTAVDNKEENDLTI